MERALPARLKAEIARELQRLELVVEMIAEIESGARRHPSRRQPGRSNATRSKPWSG